MHSQITFDKKRIRKVCGNCQGLGGQRVAAAFVEQDNYYRLYSAIGYVMLWDRLQRREVIIFAARQRKLPDTWQKRKLF